MQGRGGKGVLTIQYDRRRGKLVGALIVDLDTEVYAITSGGGVIRTLAKEVRKAKRQTMGVRLMNLSEGDSLVAIARNADAEPVGRRPATARSPPAVRRRRTPSERRARRGVVVTTQQPAPRPRSRGLPAARRRRPAATWPMAAPQHVGPPPGPRPPHRRRDRARRTRAAPRPPAGRRGWRRCS